MSVYNSKYTGAQIETRLDQIDTLPIKLTAQTLPAGSTSVTFIDNSITTDSTIIPYVSQYGIAPITITVSQGTAILTFSPQAESLSVYIRVW